MKMLTVLTALLVLSSVALANERTKAEQVHDLLSEMIKHNQSQIEKVKNDRRPKFSVKEILEMMKQNFQSADQGFSLSDPESPFETGFQLLRDKIGREYYHTENGQYATVDRERVLEELTQTLEAVQKIQKTLTMTAPQVEAGAEAVARIQKLKAQIEAMANEYHEKESRTTHLRDELAVLEGKVGGLKFAEKELTKKRDELRQAEHEFDDLMKKREKVKSLSDALYESYGKGEYTVEDHVGDIELVKGKNPEATAELRGEIAAIVRSFLRAKLDEVTMVKRTEWETAPMHLRVKANINSFHAGEGGGIFGSEKPHTVSLNIVALVGIPWEKRTSSGTLTLTILGDQISLDQNSQVELMNTFSQLGKNADDLFTETKFHTLPDTLKNLLDQGVKVEAIEEALFRLKSGVNCEDVASGKKIPDGNDSLEAELAQETPGPGTRRSPPHGSQK